MVIGIKDLISLGKQPFKRLPVSIQGNIEHGDPAPMHLPESRQQGNVPLYPRHQASLRAGGMQTQLMQGTDAVGISVEHVNAAHSAFSCIGRRVLFSCHQNQIPGDCLYWPDER